MKFKQIFEKNIEMDSEKLIDKKLIELYAIKIFAQKWKAPLKTRDRLNDNFEKYFNKLRDKNKNFTFTTMEQQMSFWDTLEQKAKQWWDKQVIKGPGKHW